ncbi:MAG: FAD/NAD(P)-binding oxidoreductase [Alphaproteobacteria bacterium]|nr:MAG: FAD/NAD(P)-binding oxidoreductase [Alphaproteobacteria bacterium]
MCHNEFGKESSPEVYDIIIVGAGVIGCAMARRFTLEGATVLIVEKGDDILGGASKGNSALLHTGFDAPPNSLELSCMQKGYQEYLEIHSRFQLPVLKTGAMVVAWTEQEEQQLPQIIEKAHANGVTDVRLIDTREVRRLEPGLSQNARAAAWIPGEYVIDPWSAPLAYLTQAIENGAHLKLSTEIRHGEFDGAVWQLQTGEETIKCRTVINCAGLYGDILEEDLLGKSSFEIRPRKGQFVVFDKIASKLMNAIILPVPTPFTKGVVVCQTIFGNVLVGPTAEEQDSRDDASVDTETLKKLQQTAIKIIPALQGVPITATYAGIRTASEEKHYRISVHENKHWITVGGIRSTGLTAALGIASHVYELYSETGQRHKSIPEPFYPVVPALAETAIRDYTQPGNRGIVCHCELVTEREIANALTGPVAAHTLEGLKRRTRATMGRCQGFYCTARLSEITQGHLVQPIAIGKCHE